MFKTLVTGALVLSLLGATAATANAQSWHPGPGSMMMHDRFEHRDYDRYERRDFDRFGHRDFDRFGGDHRWVRGERFYPVYGRSYVVGDWYRYHLSRPPYGYHWVRYGDDFLLVALGSGIIADVLLNSYY